MGRYFSSTNCQLGDTLGVERWLSDGVPLMRFFKADRTARSPEEEVAAMRLMAVANRSKAQSASTATSVGLLAAPDEQEQS